MKLAIMGQDNASITVGLVKDGAMAHVKEMSASPENHLRAVDQALGEWSVTLQDLQGVLVVTGPGSFTASRVSTTIANAIAFAQRIPIWGIENPAHRSLGDLLSALNQEGASLTTPVYDRPAHITQPATRGDNLRD